MENCIFCKIIAKEIPSYPVYEDEKVYAFLDISQTTPGHTLVIPKTHVADIFEYNEALAADLFTRVPKISRALEKALPEMAGLNILSNNKELAYQTVFHSHLHLIPRYAGDDGLSIKFTDNRERTSGTELADLAQKIAKQVN